MGWLRHGYRPDHRCNLPASVGAEDEAPGHGVVWECDECHRRWRIVVPNFDRDHMMWVAEHAPIWPTDFRPITR